MKLYNFFAKCLLALTLSCCISIIHSTAEDTYELILNGLKFYGSKDSNRKFTSVHQLALSSHILSIQLPQPKDNSKFKHCKAYAHIYFPEDTNLPKENNDFKEFHIFDCTEYSCQFDIKAYFFQSRMAGNTDLNNWKNKIADFTVECALIQAQVDGKVSPARIFWGFRTKFWTSGPIPGASDSVMESFRKDGVIEKTKATSFYIITPSDMLSSRKPLLFSSEPLEESSYDTSYVHMLPRFSRMAWKDVPLVKRRRRGHLNTRPYVAPESSSNAPNSDETDDLTSGSGAPKNGNKIKNENPQVLSNKNGGRGFSSSSFHAPAQIQVSLKEKKDQS